MEDRKNQFRASEQFNDTGRDGSPQRAASLAGRDQLEGDWGGEREGEVTLRAPAVAQAAEEAPETEEGKLLVVGIGASAGGLEALAELIKYVPLDCMSFIVVQHLAPHHESVRSGAADFCLTPKEIGEELSRIAKQPRVKRKMPMRVAHLAVPFNR